MGSDSICIDKVRKKIKKRRRRAYRKRENDMVSERQSQTDSGTDYDNLSSQTATDTDDADKTTGDDNTIDPSTNSQRSASSTPTISLCARQTITDDAQSSNSTIDVESKCSGAKERPPRSHLQTSKRAYRIIDSDVSQRLLQMVAAEKMAAAQSTERGSKVLRRKSSFIIGASKLASYHNHHQSSSPPPTYVRERNLPLAVTRTRFDVMRTASFGGNVSRNAARLSDSNRNSLPLGVLALNFEESEEVEVCLDTLKPDHRMATVVEGRLAVSPNGKQLLEDDVVGSLEHFESLQRLSFVSSSTGYSSARSSLRSSEIGDEVSSSQYSRDLSIERRLLTRETSLSEARRQKLVKSGNATQLDRIAMELLETERAYVNDLNDIIQGYLNFFVDHREEFQMTVDDVSSTFGCIERIFFFNRRLYHQLDAATLNVALMAKCFIDNIDGFKDYVTYCTNYQKMVDTLSLLMKNSMVVETLSLRQSVLGHSLPLSAYLLKPVQRVLKYHLFMENILKNSNETRTLSDSDRGLISEALDCMTAQAERINEEKKRSEHWERVKELQSALHRWCSEGSEDLSRYGDLLLEGTFKLAGSKTNRQLFLFEEMLLIVKERNGALICKDYIMCSSIMINESVSADPLAFQVLSFDNPKIQYVFLSPSIEHKRNWMKELKRMMLDHYTVEIPERTKMLMLNMDSTTPKPMQLPPDREEVFSGGSKNARRIPKYLEKRRKSVDANGVVRRSQRRERSSSRTRSLARVSKASSTGSLIPVLSAVNIGLKSREVSTCTCNTEGGATPSTSAVLSKSRISRVTDSNVTPSIVSDNSSAQSSLSSLFSRRKSHDNSRSKLFGVKKRSNNQNLPPVPSIIVHQNTNLMDNAGDIACTRCGNPDTARCSCNLMSTPNRPDAIDLSPTHSDASSSSPNESPINEHIENTFAELCKELNLLMCSPDSPEDCNPAKNLARKRSSEMRQVSISNRRKETKNTEEKPEECRQRRGRSRSVGRIDKDLRVRLADSSLGDAVADQSTDAFVIEPIENNSEVFVSGRVFEKILDDKKGGESSSEGEDESDLPKGVNWTESPAIRERSSHTASGVHHRRRSSQVAEQVWRLRNKNGTVQRSGENCVDGKSFGTYTTPTGIPLRVTVTEYQARKSSVPSMLSTPFLKLSRSDRRHSIGVQMARQRTPLTVEQCAQLEGVLIEPSLGVVKEMVKQLERPARCVLTSTPNTVT